LRERHAVVAAASRRDTIGGMITRHMALAVAFATVATLAGSTSTAHVDRHLFFV
jgi:hypothetical protein